MDDAFKFKSTSERFKHKLARIEDNITPIPRGADLTDDDLRQIVDDCCTIIRWTLLQPFPMPVHEIKTHVLTGLKLRLGHNTRRTAK